MSNAEAIAAHLRHELRTPINAILGYSQLLLDEADEAGFSETERDSLTHVAEAGRQLLRIVNDGLEPARLRDDVQSPLTLAMGHVATLLDGRRAGTPADDLRRIHTALVYFGEFVETIEHIPLTPASAEPDEAAPVGGEILSGTILVIDDEEANRALLTRRLARQGHQVLTAETGETGIAVAASQPVDVILLDVMMPGLSGYEVLARLKQEPGLREIPVLMITAVDGSASVTRCITLGADDYLAKPFDPIVLAARVGACVAKKRARDFELAYLRGVASVTEAAAAVESGRFDPATLDVIAARTDALGQLARLFQRMGVEVAARERRLEAQVHQLTIAIDERKMAAQVHEITESDYFRELKARAHQFSGRRAARGGGGS
jgi:DNA-binding response OmpR family regulator